MAPSNTIPRVLPEFGNPTPPYPSRQAPPYPSQFIYGTCGVDKCMTNRDRHLPNVDWSKFPKNFLDPNPYFPPPQVPRPSTILRPYDIDPDIEVILPDLEDEKERQMEKERKFMEGQEVLFEIMRTVPQLPWRPSASAKKVNYKDLVANKEKGIVDPPLPTPTIQETAAEPSQANHVKVKAPSKKRTPTQSTKPSTSVSYNLPDVNQAIDNQLYQPAQIPALGHPPMAPMIQGGYGGSQGSHLSRLLLSGSKLAQKLPPLPQMSLPGPSDVWTPPPNMVEEVKENKIQIPTPAVARPRELSMISETSERSSNDSPPSVESPGSDTEMPMPTDEVCEVIKSELKRLKIPQSVFAERLLGRTQGTLSDLLRNPRPWNELKAGKDTFKRMYYWTTYGDKEKMEAIGMTETGGVLPMFQGVVTPGLKSKRGSITGTAPATKRARILFTDEQKRVLEAAFEINREPSKSYQMELARQLEIEVTSVHNYFTNARRRKRYSFKNKIIKDEVEDYVEQPY